MFDHNVFALYTSRPHAPDSSTIAGSPNAEQGSHAMRNHHVFVQRPYVAASSKSIRGAGDKGLKLPTFPSQIQTQGCAGLRLLLAVCLSGKSLIRFDFPCADPDS